MSVDPKVAIDRIQKAFKGPHGTRTLHAKGHFYEGTFTATPEAAALSKAGHLQGTPVPVLVRWSNGGGNPGVSDKAPDVRGMAVSFKLAGGTATDLLGQTAPNFPVRTPEAFLDLVEAAQKPWKLPLFLLRHQTARKALLANVKAKALAPPSSYAAVTYYPVHAYQWVAADGSTCWVRYVFRPQPSSFSGEFDGRDRLQDEIVARLAAGPVRYDVEVTVAADGDDPHDPTATWKGARTFVAGVIEVTGPAAQDPEADGNVVVFDPTRVVDGIGLSDDPILLYRPLAYSESVNRRI